MIEVISPRTSADFEQYYQLRWQILRAPWRQEQGSEQDEWEQQAIHRMLVNQQGQVVAVGRLHRSSQFQGHIRYMAVAENYQGQGLGKKLLSVLEQIAQELGVRELSLNARSAAMDFYQQNDYQEQGKSHILFGQVQHFAMTKTLIALNSLEQLSQELQTTWHTTIPLSKAMNITIASVSDVKLIASCDLRFNKNLHNTMFAGSIYTLATLTGWGWLHLLFAQQNMPVDLVLGKGEIRYHAPLRGVAHAEVLSENVKGDVLAIERKGKARFSIEVRVYCGDILAASFNGHYFALAKNKE